MDYQQKKKNVPKICYTTGTKSWNRCRLRPVCKSAPMVEDLGPLGSAVGRPAYAGGVTEDDPVTSSGMTSWPPRLIALRAGPSMHTCSASEYPRVGA